MPIPKIFPYAYYTGQALLDAVAEERAASRALMVSLERIAALRADQFASPGDMAQACTEDAAAALARFKGSRSSG